MSLNTCLEQMGRPKTASSMFASASINQGGLALIANRPIKDTSKTINSWYDYSKTKANNCFYWQIALFPCKPMIST